MKCPKCQAPMETRLNAFSDYEQCIHCKGLWLNALEDQKLKLVAEVIDSGDAEIGKQYNQMDDVYCPECPNNKMLKMVDPQQPHIWFEQCPTCYGRYYDAGEFKDLSEHSVSDFFKKFAAKERK